MAVFGEEIKRIRSELGLNQTAFGEAIGYSRTLVSNWERLLDDPPPPRSEIEKWEIKLDLTPGQVDCLLVSAGYQPRYGTSGEHGAVGVLRASEIHTSRLVVDQIEQPKAPSFTPEDLKVYLDNVVAACETLDLRGTGGPVAKLPLERVYMGLKADPSNPAERRANERQLIRELERELDLGDLDERARLAALKRFIARRDPIGLTLTLRDRDKGGDGTYLGRTARRVDLAELVAEERWAVLLGDPGSGKTTLVRWLALQFGRALRDGALRVKAPAAHVRTEDREQGIEGVADLRQTWLPVQVRLADYAVSRSPQDCEQGTEGVVDLGPARLPVPVRLADYAAARWPEGRGDTGLTLFDYLGGQPWQGRALHPEPEIGRAIVQQHVRQGQALLLLDGLDEITDRTRRGKIVDAVHYLLCTHVREPQSGACAAEAGSVPLGQDVDRPQVTGGNQVLITSRVIGYYAAPLASTLPHYTVEEMSAEAIGRFCAVWTQVVYGVTRQGEPEADGERLRGALLESGKPGLAEIAANPLLLTILAGLFYTLEGRLPDRRVLLYWQVVQAFLKQRWDYWATAGLVLDEKVKGPFHYALGYLATQLHANPAYPNALVDEEQAVAWLQEALEKYEGRRAPKLRTQAEVILQGARDAGGFLLERGDGVYGFIHRTFQEYFAALYLAWDERGVGEAIYARLEEPAWQEVLVLTVAQVGRRPRSAAGVLREILAAPEPTGGLLPRGALFVASCLPELTGDAPAEVVERTCDQLIVAYADRSWPPDETSQPPEPLRDAIEQRLRGLQALPGATSAAAKALTSDSGPQRLAAAELILATEWTHSGLVTPLIAAVRDTAEPVATVREALLRQYRTYPEAFTAASSPMRDLLVQPRAAERLKREPMWGAILDALYLDPERDRQKPLAAVQVVFDSSLTPVLRRGWAEEWSAARLIEMLERMASRRDGSALARDAGWALAVADDAAWRRWLADASADRAYSRPILAGLSWLTRDLGRNLALALDHAFPRNFAFPRNHDLPRNHDRYLDLYFARDHARNVSRDLFLARGHARDLFHARDRDLFVARDHALSTLDEVADDLRAALTLTETDGTAEIQGLLTSAQAQVDVLRGRLTGPDYRALGSAAEVLDPNHTRMQDGRLWIDETLWGEAGGLAAEDHARLALPSSDAMPDALATRIKTDAIIWASSCDPVLKRSAALLLAELGEIPAGMLPWVVSLLTEPADLWRYRARLALTSARPASAWGEAALAMLAGCAGEERGEAADAYLASTFCEWALNEVMHDRADWLAAWAEEGAGGKNGRRILSGMHKVEEKVWPAYLKLLADSAPAAQEALLEAASWLLQLSQVSDAYQEALVDVLLRLSGEAAPVGGAAIKALGCCGQASVGTVEIKVLGCWGAPERVVTALLERTAATEVPAGVWEALARVATEADAETQARIDARLGDAPAGTALDAALARRSVWKAARRDAHVVLGALAERCPEPGAQLTALLGAGGDDDVWGSYHEGVVTTIRVLVQKREQSLVGLVTALRTAMTADSWPQQRIALAALAACAEVMPAQLNEATDDLEALLLKATHNAHSHSTRRFATTALSYLRVVGPDVLEAILRLAIDVEAVQADAISAVRRFNRLDASLGEELPGALVAALHGESTARAYVACELLAALGSSQAAEVTPGLRKQIVAVLAEALRDERSRRAVWLLKYGQIEQKGTLDQHLYAALLRVSGLGR